MRVADQIKILDKKTKQNQAQYDLARKSAKTSALSSGNLDKYKYLTGEDLDYKPSTVKPAKYSSLKNILENDWMKKAKKKDF